MSKLSISDAKYIINTIILEIAIKEDRDVDDLYYNFYKKSGNFYIFDAKLKGENGKDKIWFKTNINEL